MVPDALANMIGFFSIATEPDWRPGWGDWSTPVIPTVW